jgi:hypothetical protein
MSKGTPLWTFRKKKVSYIFFYISRLISGLRVEWANKSVFEFFFWGAFFLGGVRFMLGPKVFSWYPLWGVYTWGKRFLTQPKRNQPKPTPLGWENTQKRFLPPPPGGGQEFFWVRLVPLGVYTIHPNPFPTLKSDFKTGRLSGRHEVAGKKTKKSKICIFWVFWGGFWLG